MARKPKFRVGQVVVERATDNLYRVRSKALREKRWVYWMWGYPEYFNQAWMRSLTKREAGR
jgi:hypothetical protein